MSLPGRNDPCPCGSGQKFKKCSYGCFEAQEILERNPRARIDWRPSYFDRLDEQYPDSVVEDTFLDKLP